MAWPAPLPGWKLEPRGDAGPRGMAVSGRFARPRQNPAYRPARVFQPTFQSVDEVDDVDPVEGEDDADGVDGVHPASVFLGPLRPQSPHHQDTTPNCRAVLGSTPLRRGIPGAVSACAPATTGGSPGTVHDSGTRMGEPHRGNGGFP